MNNQTKELTYYTTHTILEQNRSIKGKNYNEAELEQRTGVDHVLSAYTIATKNIYNSAYFIIRQIISSYTYSKTINDSGEEEIHYILKDKLHVNTQNILHLTNEVITQLNQKKDTLTQSKIDKELKGIKSRKSKTPEKTRKQTYYQLFTNKIDTKTYFQHLDVNLISNVLKLKELNSKNHDLNINSGSNKQIVNEKDNGLNIIYKDYLEVSSHVATAAVALVVQDMNNYYASLKYYYKENKDNSVNNTKTKNNNINISNNKLNKPKLPRYKQKNSCLGFSLDKSRFNQEGIIARVITKDNIHSFTSIKDKTNINCLYADNTKTVLLEQKHIEAYNNFRFLPYINKKINSLIAKEKDDLNRINKIYAKEQFNSKLQIELVELKFLPLKHKNRYQYQTQIQIVVKHTLNLPNNSALSQLLTINSKYLELKDEAKIQFIQELINLNNKIKNDQCNIINDLFQKNIASIDMGTKNCFSIAFNNNKKAKVISGNQYNKDTARFDAKIDKRKSILSHDLIKEIQPRFIAKKVVYNEQKEKVILEHQALLENALNALTIEHKKRSVDIKSSNVLLNNDIQNNPQLKLSAKEIKHLLNLEKDSFTLNKNELNKNYQELLKEKLTQLALTKPKLTTEEQKILKDYQYICSQDKVLIQLQKHKQNYINDVVHKMSHHIIDMCLNNNIDYLVIGKNNNWKQKVNLGAQNNREFYNFPHTKLIEKIQYKALKYGIVVLLTEESYTSKTSFMNNISLKSIDNNEKLKNDVNKIDNGNRINKILNSNENQEVNVVNSHSIKNINSSQEELQQSVKAITAEVKEVLSKTNLNVLNKDNIEINNKKMKSKVDSKTLTYHGGKRISRDIYSNDINPKTLTKGIKRFVHADVNACFNIMRKVFTHMTYNPKCHNFNYDVLGYKLNKKYLYCLI